MEDVKFSSVRDQDIFSYRPTITYDRQINSAIESTSAESSTLTTSPVMEDFIQYAPHQVSKTLKQRLDILNEKLDILSQRLSHLSVNGMTFKQYQALLKKQPFVTLDEMEQLEQFEQLHIPSIEGEVGVEIYKQLAQSIQTLQSITHSFNNYVYQTKDPDDARYEEEQALIQQLIKVDQEGDLQKINYLAIAIDTQFSRSVLDLSQHHYTFGLNLYNQYVLPDDAYPLMEAVEPAAVESLFERLNKVYEKDEEKLLFYNKRNVFDHLIERIKKQREEALLSYANVNGLEYAAQEDTVIRSLLASQSMTIFSGLVELVKFGTSTAMYLNDFEKMIQEKEVVRRLYKTQM